MTTSAPTLDQDIEIIREMLEHLRNFANDHRWSGWHEEWGLAKAALEALARLEADVKNRQTEMKLSG